MPIGQNEIFRTLLKYFENFHIFLRFNFMRLIVEIRSRSKLIHNELLTKVPVRAGAIFLQCFCFPREKTEGNNNNEDSIMSAWLPLLAKECICEHIA